MGSSGRVAASEMSAATAEVASAAKAAGVRSATMLRQRHGRVQAQRDKQTDQPYQNFQAETAEQNLAEDRFAKDLARHMDTLLLPAAAGNQVCADKFILFP